MPPTRRPLAALYIVMLVSLGWLAPADAAGQSPSPAQPPAVGDELRDFTLTRIDGKPITLSALAKEGPVVMIVLRGWVGYQCPICSRQMTGFMGQAQAFQAAGANVVLVYPGAADVVQQKAEDFVTGKSLPDRYHFVIDPDLEVVNLYGLRWDAPQETAYPSTFVVDTRGIVRFAKISRSHGDRSSAPDVLAVLQGLK